MCFVFRKKNFFRLEQKKDKPSLCNTPVPGFRELKFNGNNYFWSGNHNETKKEKYNWLYARNLCREYCMDAVSIDDQKENEFVKGFMKKNKIKALWTSGAFSIKKF